MKRLFSLFAGALAALILTCAPAQAQYLGCFDSNQPYALEVLTQSKVSLTILQVTSKGRLDVEEVRVYEQTLNSYEGRVFPPNVARVIFKADATMGGSGLLKIIQSAQKFELTVEPHVEAVIDLSPGPNCGGG